MGCSMSVEEIEEVTTTYEDMERYRKKIIQSIIDEEKAKDQNTK